jgi:hypothetical protein
LRRRSPGRDDGPVTGLEREVTITLEPDAFYAVSENLRVSMFTPYAEEDTLERPDPTAGKISEALSTGAVQERQDVDDDYTVTLPLQDWVYIRERARSMEIPSGPTGAGGIVIPVGVGPALVDLISSCIGSS